MQSNDSADLTRVGPGTVMGEFMRQFWMPAALSSEVTPDGDPLRLMIMGENISVSEEATASRRLRSRTKRT